MYATPQSPLLHWLFSVARVSGKPCSPTCSTPPSIVYPSWWLSCSTLLSLPPAPRSKLVRTVRRSEEHTSELQSLMRISYAVFCLKKNNNTHTIQPYISLKILPEQFNTQ